MKQNPAIFIVHAREQLGERSKLTFLFRSDRSTPKYLRRYIRLRHSITVREEPVHRDLQGLSHLFQRIYGGHGVPIFDARDVTPEKPSPFFNVALGHVFLLSQRLQFVADDHSNPRGEIIRLVCESGNRRLD
jgi:hypothetical protein